MFVSAVAFPFPKNAYYAIFGYSQDTDLPADAQETLEYIVRTLPQRETEMFMLKFREDMTYIEIGEKYDLSKQRVQQIIAKTICKLRHSSRSKILTMGREAYLKSVVAASIEEKRLYYECICELEALIHRQIQDSDNSPEHLSGFDRQKRIQTDRILGMSINCLGLSTRSWNCLSRAGIHTIRDIYNYGDLREIRSMGRISVQEVQDKLSALREAMGAD